MEKIKFSKYRSLSKTQSSWSWNRYHDYVGFEAAERGQKYTLAFRGGDKSEPIEIREDVPGLERSGELGLLKPAEWLRQNSMALQDYPS